MKQLYLFRHAKSSWELAGELDYQRGLTERGRDDCALIAKLIEERGIAPDLVLCSGARRARETLEAVAAALPPATVIEYEDEIYRSTIERLTVVLRGVSEDHQSVMLVGHNPSIHDLAVDLAASGEELESMAGKFPTAALAELEFDAPWAAIGTDVCVLTDFTRPKQLRVAS